MKHGVRRIAVTVLLTFLQPGCGWAQEERGLVEDFGVWHSLQELRAAVRDHTVTRDVAVHAARVELALGRPERARELLADREVPEDAEDLALLGAIEFRTEQYARAGDFFARAAAAAVGARRGELAARAAAAYEEAGRLRDAAVQYRAAAADLPLVAGWLAVREARVTVDSVRAFALLRWAPPEADRLAAIARAAVRLRAGDSVAATAQYVAAQEWGRAAELVATLGDSGAARGLAYRVLEAPNPRARRVVLDAVQQRFPPETPEERLLVAEAWRRAGSSRTAVELMRQAVAHGDSSAVALRRLADLEAGVRRHDRALRAYAQAALRGGEDGTLAAYNRARLLVRMRRRSEGHRELLAFADRYPQHARAPAAIFIVADDLEDARRRVPADSLYGVIAERWPADEYASRARHQLAGSALARGDTQQAMRWYQAEFSARGTQRHAAQFFLARLHAAAGDSAEARLLWAKLAESDVAGYYGVRAREAAALPPPRFTAATRRDPAADRITRQFDRLDLLRRAQLYAEADEFVRHLTTATSDAPDAMLVLANGLIARGWVIEGVNLGWRATGHLPLRDARVLRAIYPWRFRELIEAEAQKHGLDPYLLVALIRQESTFRPAVVSHAGAHGLMQLMPSTATHLARRLGVEWDDAFLTVADANVHIGAAHLASLLQQFDGALVPSLAAYNAGSRPVRRWLRYPEAADPFLFVERIPYDETRGFVRSVLRNYVLYRALYPPVEDHPADQR